jgi:type IV pilus assembly protein PilB
MGVPSYNLATSVDLIIAQRLARRLCGDCAISTNEIPTQSLLDFGFNEELLVSASIKKAIGCKNCTDGYKGRIGVFEVLRISPEISKLIMESANSITIYNQARKEGFFDLRQSALVKAARGLISLEEVNRITIQ